jgi:two-component system KDP operon response regulator KdpE
MLAFRKESSPWEELVTAKLLVVDTESASIRELWSVLAGEGYQVERALPNRDALRRIVVDDPDLVILGIDQSDENDWYFCQQLTPILDQPLFLLISAEDEIDAARGLDLGADDCMANPWSQTELLARIRALLRRQRAAKPERHDVLQNGDLYIDLTLKRVWIKDKRVRLTPTEYRLLACLARNRGRYLPCERLLAEVWGPGLQNPRALVKQYIYHLRKKLESDSR